ncbi:MAG TPA: hypothetical protein VFU09_01305 [Candidatus Udaeobacter sp.]|nr:hypothetical protein [Candidatus Udaeobacter sp.]
MQNCFGNIAGVIVGPIAGFIVDRTISGGRLPSAPLSQFWAEFRGSNWLATSRRSTGG